MMYPVTVKQEYSESLPKADFTLHLEEHGIETRDILPLINQPFYVEKFGDLESRFPIARWVNHNGFYMSCHQQLDEQDLDFMIETVRSFVTERVSL